MKKLRKQQAAQIHLWWSTEIFQVTCTSHKNKLNNSAHYWAI